MLIDDVSLCNEVNAICLHFFQMQKVILMMMVGHRVTVLLWCLSIQSLHARIL